MVKVKRKVHTTTGHEVLEVRGEPYLYYFFNLGVRWGCVVSATPRPLYPRDRPGTHCTGGCVDPKTSPDR